MPLADKYEAKDVLETYSLELLDRSLQKIWKIDINADKFILATTKSF